VILCIWTEVMCAIIHHTFCSAPGLHFKIYIPKIPGLPKFGMLSVDDTTVWIAAVLILRRASVNIQQSVWHLFHPQYKNYMSLYQTTSKRFYILDFKLLTCSECCMLSSGWFTSVCSLNNNVSEHSTCSYQDRTERSKMLACKIQMLVHHPEQSIQYFTSHHASVLMTHYNKHL
jgi:hypothetical protein